MKFKDHPLCRPPTGTAAGKTMRLGLNNQWNPDNGKPGLAFASRLTSKQAKTMTPTLWVANCSCKIYADCVLPHALNTVAEMFGGASVERMPPTKRRS